MSLRTGFLVFPDTPGAFVRDHSYPFEEPGSILHPSGRPWLVGTWRPDEIRQAQTGPVRLVVIGHCPVTTDRLVALCGRIRRPADVDTLARELPGSFHLVSVVEGTTRVQGSLSGLRQVFHSRIGRVPVAADRADVLAAMTGAGIWALDLEGVLDA
jgi:asparagine synthase (glutamine-hydrolysing)